MVAQIWWLPTLRLGVLLWLLSSMLLISRERWVRAIYYLMLRAYTTVESFVSMTLMGTGSQLITSIAGHSKPIASMLPTMQTVTIVIILPKLLLLILEVVIFSLVTFPFIPLLLIIELICLFHCPLYIDSCAIHILIRGILMHWYSFLMIWVRSCLKMVHV